MQAPRFSLPGYLPETSGALADELAVQEEKLRATGLAELLARIEALAGSGKTPAPAADTAIRDANRSQNGHKWPVCSLVRFPKPASGSFFRSLLGKASPGFSIQDGAVCSRQLLDGAEQVARELIPWRKGPFQLGQLQIDAEWRSDIKWNRLKSHLPDMAGKTVADVGCNNGYYLYRIAEAGAKNILGLDPTLKYYLQYRLIAAHTGQVADFLPLGYQALWQMPKTFDAIFLMGVNYHDPDPLEMFHACRHALREGGTLICESVVVETDADLEIFPEGKYAGIGGVYAIPSPRTLKRQLTFVGFQSVTLLYSEALLPAEQRRSEFSPQASLVDHLREGDLWSKEGYPPPYRAALLCR